MNAPEDKPAANGLRGWWAYPPLFGAYLLAVGAANVAFASWELTIADSVSLQP
jgi:hypothetical protein